MILPIRLNTKEGESQFNILYMNFNIAKANFDKEYLRAFNNECAMQYKNPIIVIEEFLDKTELDIENFNVYNILSDSCSNYLYFSKKKL